METLNYERECAMQARRVAGDVIDPNDEYEWLPNDDLLIHVSDHGNVTVYDMDRNELWSCV